MVNKILCYTKCIFVRIYGAVKIVCSLFFTFFLLQYCVVCQIVKALRSHAYEEFICSFLGILRNNNLRYLGINVFFYSEYDVNFN